MPKRPTRGDGATAEPELVPTEPEAAATPPTALEVMEEEELALPSAGPVDPRETSVEARIVYLGGNPRKSVYLEGSTERMADPDDPENEAAMLHVPRGVGAESYVFERLDTRGRPVKDRLMADGPHRGKPWVICRHIGHIIRFIEERDADGGPAFAVLATRAVQAKIRRHRERLDRRRRLDTESGEAVLADMQRIGAIA